MAPSPVSYFLGRHTGANQMINQYVYKGLTKKAQEIWLKIHVAAIQPAGKRPDKNVSDAENTFRRNMLKKVQKEREAELVHVLAKRDAQLHVCDIVFVKNEVVDVDMETFSARDATKLRILCDQHVLTHLTVPLKKSGK